MDATAIALLVTTIGSLVTAGATALAGLRQSRAALLAAERAEKQAAEAERRAAEAEHAFDRLLKPTLYSAPPTEAQRERFAVAGKVLAEGAAALRATAGTKAFPQISSAHELLGQRIAGLLPERDFYERAALLRALGDVRLAATRAAGAASSVGDMAAWRDEVGARLRALEMATVTAITATADYAEEWRTIARRHQID